MMTNQEAFDKVLAHLRKQGRAAMDAGMCVYRAPDGCMCAVGCLIPDELYDKGIEGYQWHEFENEAISEYLSGVDENLLIAMQDAHDDALSKHGVVAWEAAMRRIARSFSLKYT